MELIIPGGPCGPAGPGGPCTVACDESLVDRSFVNCTMAVTERAIIIPIRISSNFLVSIVTKRYAPK